MRATLTIAGYAALAVAALALAGVTGCGGDSETAAPTTETTVTVTLPTEPETETTEATETTTETTAETTEAAPQVTVVRIRIRDGKSVGGIVRATVGKGDRVRIVVTSDVTDEVHLHGYDLAADVSPSSRAVIAFRATIPGRFEIELEDRGLQIGELEVRP